MMLTFGLTQGTNDKGSKIPQNNCAVFAQFYGGPLLSLSCGHGEGRGEGGGWKWTRAQTPPAPLVPVIPRINERWIDLGPEVRAGQ